MNRLLRLSWCAAVPPASPAVLRARRRAPRGGPRGTGYPTPPPIGGRQGRGRGCRLGPGLSSPDGRRPLLPPNQAAASPRCARQLRPPPASPRTRLGPGARRLHPAAAQSATPVHPRPSTAPLLREARTTTVPPPTDSPERNGHPELAEGHGGAVAAQRNPRVESHPIAPAHLASPTSAPVANVSSCPPSARHRPQPGLEDAHEGADRKDVRLVHTEGGRRESVELRGILGKGGFGRCTADGTRAPRSR
eukprot:TRINITY_DN11191_c0_g1_i1.p2 TRINITY_DN11191_c0_g1~~TRINITY_DN11191_c0_g1_i1.p2  ORF type:complete len:276 (+),score=0.82 TRINITY_DN11191_c0_g1_i1:84-830(+)